VWCGQGNRYKSNFQEVFGISWEENVEAFEAHVTEEIEAQKEETID
jgi:hypothetical protein